LVLNAKGKEAQGLVLQAIHELTLKRGYAPSYREIAAEMGTVQSNVHYHIRNLVAAGLVHDTPNTARALRLSDTGHAARIEHLRASNLQTP
jgi:SOS-response transcriptional repressor LexA